VDHAGRDFLNKVGEAERSRPRVAGAGRRTTASCSLASTGGTSPASGHVSLGPPARPARVPPRWGVNQRQARERLAWPLFFSEQASMLGSGEGSSLWCSEAGFIRCTPPCTNPLNEFRTRGREIPVCLQPARRGRLLFCPTLTPWHGPVEKVSAGQSNLTHKCMTTAESSVMVWNRRPDAAGRRRQQTGFSGAERQRGVALTWFPTLAASGPRPDGLPRRLRA
jgi:hypothetical protein